MLAFLSDEWVAALHEAASTDDRLHAACAELSLIVEQEVTGGPNGDVRYHVVLEQGRAAVRLGPADQPSLRFSQDYETASSITLGHGSAQRAFMTGQLRIGGDLRLLLAHREVLAQLHDVFADVRTRTTAG